MLSFKRSRLEMVELKKIKYLKNRIFNKKKRKKISEFERLDYFALTIFTLPRIRQYSISVPGVSLALGTSSSSGKGASKYS